MKCPDKESKAKKISEFKNQHAISWKLNGSQANWKHTKNISLSIPR